VLAGFSITVNAAPNQPPTIGGSPSVSVVENSAYSFTPTANDPDGDNLTFLITGKPSWASFNVSNGRLSGTPSAGQDGVYSNIRISVSDGEDTATLSAFSITVEALPNRAPTIGGNPANEVSVNAAYSFTPSASDPDGDDLTFSISGKPSWVNFDTGNGRLSGTPAEGDESVYGSIRITVSDGTDSASLPAFSITVLGLPNNPPIIGGTPSGEVTVGSDYGFSPTIDDPDGDDLTFSISGKPAWATFQAGTGRLFGTPGAGDVGTYADIVISVSDGTDSVSLPAFDIDVVALTARTATLFWVAPTENTDGSDLTDLAGYNVYYGTSLDSMALGGTVDNPTVTTHLVENLTPGTWFFTVTAFDIAGNESEDSNLASKVVMP
jgi:hypothetical protein